LQFGQQFQAVGNVCLRLAFEKTFVSALSKTRGRIHDKFRIGRKWNATVAGEIKPVRRLPFVVGFIRSDFELDQIIFPMVMFRHCRERFPIDAFFIYAQAAPFRLVLKYLMGELVDAGTGLAGAGVAGDIAICSNFESHAFPQPCRASQCSHHVSRNEPDAPAPANGWNRALPLLVSQPAQAWRAVWSPQEFQQLWGVDQLVERIQLLARCRRDIIARWEGIVCFTSSEIFRDVFTPIALFDISKQEVVNDTQFDNRY
jgi:hypothetical protein